MRFCQILQKLVFPSSYAGGFLELRGSSKQPRQPISRKGQDFGSEVPESRFPGPARQGTLKTSKRMEGRVSSPGTLTEEEANELVVEHRGWAESIARSVARGWNLDWQMDGLDGAAMEALIFCSRRFDPARGVPFKGYARRRIHEASSDAARKCKGWRRSRSESSSGKAKEISVGLLNVFPELRSGSISGDEHASSGEDSLRSGIRQLLVGATMIASQQASPDALPDQMFEYKRVVEKSAVLEPIHQQLLWKVYWEGSSMRGLATNWETDELNVIREHKAILGFLAKAFKAGRKEVKPLKIRPGLKDIALRLKKTIGVGVFRRLLRGERPDGR